MSRYGVGNNAGHVLGSSITATGVGQKVQLTGPKHSFSAQGVTGSGSGAATIIIEVTNVKAPSATAGDADWHTAGTITLTLGTTKTSDGFNIDANWMWARYRVSAISGTGASLIINMGN